MIEKRVEGLSSYITEKPARITGVFLVLTLFFLAGLGNITTETGTSQFSEGTAAQNALENVQSEFGAPFSTSPASTTLIKTSQNALSKKALLDMLRLEKKLTTSGLSVSSASSAADIVATALNPNATTYNEKIDALEKASPARIDRVIDRLSSNPGFTGLVSNDFNAESGYASGLMGVVTHSFSSGGSSMSSSSQLTQSQERIARYADDTIVFGQGIISSEFTNVIMDSLIIVVPASSILIIFFLVYSYRDPFDLILGVVSLVMAIIWTFGFMGLVGIPFSQMLIAVPPLLLAVGIDFGIHAVNRYKEERLESGMDESMYNALRQLLVAFFMVSGTTVIGFLSNMTSSLGPIRDFGLIAGIGIVFTALIFGIFLPSAKLLLDRKREEMGINILGERPVGSEDSLLGELLPLTAKLGENPYVAVGIFLVMGLAIGNYGMGVSTSFSQEDFLPPSDVPDYLEQLPEPFRPHSYTATRTMNLIEDKFAGQSSVILYIEAPMRDPVVLEAVKQRSQTVPSSFVTREGKGQYQSILDVMDSLSQRSPQFRALIDRHDFDNDGVPDENLEKIYSVMRDKAPDSTGQYLSDNYRSTKVVYTVESTASQNKVTNDAKNFAREFRAETTATGQTIVFAGISDTIFSSAIKALAISLLVSGLFLVVMYYLVFDKPFLAIANLFPVVFTLSLIVGTMRYLDIPLNALTATILSITIGLGVDYSVHVTHRFEDELKKGEEVFDALKVTLQGTGGALTSSMLTTVTGIIVLVFAITPILGQFGLITGISILYAYLSSLIVLPPALIIWHRWRG